MLRDWEQVDGSKSKKWWDEAAFVYAMMSLWLILHKPSAKDAAKVHGNKFGQEQAEKAAAAATEKRKRDDDEKAEKADKRKIAAASEKMSGSLEVMSTQMGELVKSMQTPSPAGAGLAQAQDPRIDALVGRLDKLEGNSEKSSANIDKLLSMVTGLVNKSG